MMPALLELPPHLVKRICGAATARRTTPESVIGEALTMLDAGIVGLEPMSGRIADRSIAGFESCSRAAAALVKELQSDSPDTAFLLDLLTCIEANYSQAAADLCAVIQGAGDAIGTA